MHHEPLGIAAIVAGVSQLLLTLFGVDYYAMLWAFIGSLLAITQTLAMTRTRAIIYVLLSTLIGAVLGSAAVAFLGTGNRAFLAVLSCVGGVGHQTLIALLLKVAEGRINSFLPGAPDK